MAAISWCTLPWDYHWLYMVVFFVAYGQEVETDDHRHNKLDLLSLKTPLAILKRVSLLQLHHPTDIQYSDSRVDDISVNHFYTL